MGKIPIGGIKLGPRLHLLKIRHPPTGDPLRWNLWEKLTERKINLFYLTTVCTNTHVETAFCILQENEGPVWDLLHSDGRLKARVRLVPAVGPLSIFPHQYSFEMFGLSLSALGKARIPLHGLASSVSSLTFLTDYDLLDSAAAAMLEFLELPSGQAPIRQPIPQPAENPEEIPV
ncbi:MAG: hypothetical protein JRH13_11750 [Deltaproteobacteria bacterium]|nr:hypothetical protein [Deltaproteobacteria bacterium]MBW2017100.1 hypothetical protein [Deltaproteobacteria bacterium]MBW2130025.1 hypothetical protein [Deltaproteobacteria bacterium]MBW2302987.1 hypothetical protein [Deltaproteobacteria bacterium]